MAVTVAPAGASVLTVNGPSTLCAPLTVAGVTVRVGGGGWTSGPSLMILAVMAATVLCNVSEVFST